MDPRSTAYEFVCPDCEAALTVDGAMRRTLLDRGCAICRAAVPPRAFTRRRRRPSAGGRSDR
jgi:hypothetical protein